MALTLMSQTSRGLMSICYRRLRLHALAPIRESFKRGKISAPELGYTFGEDSGGVAMNELFHAISL